MKILKIIIFIIATAIIVLIVAIILFFASFFNSPDKVVSVIDFKNVSYRVIYKGDQGALGIGYVDIYEESKDASGNVKSNRILSEDGINASVIKKGDSTFIHVWGQDDKIFSLYKGELSRIELDLNEFEELTFDDERIKLSFNNVFILQESVYFKDIDTCYIETDRNKPRIVIKSNNQIYYSNTNEFCKISRLDSINQKINSIINQYPGFEEIVYSMNEINLKFKNGYLKQYKTTDLQSAMIVSIFEKPAIEFIFKDTSTIYSNIDKIQNNEEMKKIVTELNRIIKLNDNSPKSKVIDIKHKSKSIGNEYLQLWPVRIFSFGQGSVSPSVVSPMSLRKASIRGAELGVWHSLIDSTFNLKINKAKIINDLINSPEGKKLEDKILNYLRSGIIYDGIEYYNDGSVKISGYTLTDSIKKIINDYLTK